MNKYFTNKIVKTFHENSKKKNLLVKKKQQHMQKEKHSLPHSLHILLLFKNFFIPFFLSSQDTLKARIFRNNAIPLKIYLLHKIISQPR